ncbi:MAG: hypothetical protein K1X74_02275 [Pirellulales bacterium]|nr:hypothetical protein [Pirellulales bacterium]
MRLSTLALLIFAVAGAFLGGYWLAGGEMPLDKSHEAVAWFRIEPSPPGAATDPSMDPAEFQIYCRSQASLIRTPLVLAAALRNAEVARLPAIAAQKDKVAFLQEQLSVTFPDDGMLMRIAMRGGDPQQLEAIVGAVCVAYQKEVISQERLVKGTLLTKLNDVLRKNLEEITAMRDKIERLAAATGSGSSEAARRKLAALDRDLLAAHEELIVAQRHVNDLELQIGRSQSKLDTANSKEPSIDDQKITAWLRDNPDYALLEKELTDLTVQLDGRESSSRVDSIAAKRVIETHRARIKQLKDEKQQLRAVARAELVALEKQALVTEAQNELDNYSVELRLRQDALRRGHERLAAMQEQVAQLTKNSGALLAKQTELHQLEETYARLAAQVGSLQVELDAPDRVRLLSPARARDRGLWERLTRR